MSGENLIKKILILLLYYGFFATLLVQYFNFFIVDYLDEGITVIAFSYILGRRLWKTKISIDKGVIYLFMLACIGIIGNLVSNINTEYSFLGMFLIIKSYLIYYIFSDIEWKEKNIQFILKTTKWIYVIFIILGILFYFVPSLAPFNSFGMSSICNHPAIFATLVVPLVLYLIITIVETGNWKFMVPLVIVFICVILANTSKNIISIGVVVIAYMFISKKQRKFIFIILGIVAIMLLSRQIISVLSVDYQSYILSETAVTRPRTLLFTTSFQIAKDFFPLGSGFGTYASSIARTHYSDIYYLYDLYYRNGLTPTNGVYLTDTYWPSILGETGIFGTLLLICLLVRITKVSVKNYKYCVNLQESILGYCIIFSFIALITESLFTSTFFSMKCYFVMGSLGIFNNIMHRRRKYAT